MNRLTGRLYKWIPVITAVYAMTCPTAAAQGGDVAMQVRMQQVVKSHAINHDFMGTVLVAKGDDVLLNRGYGMADMSWHIPNTPDVKFRIGSVNKQFTAALVLLLQEDGKLWIDQPVSTYLPNAPATWKNITLANLLGHTSGIPDALSDKQFLEWSMGPHTHEEVMAFYRDFFRDEPLGFAPGSKFEYSSSNYVVLGMVIEKVSGKSYRDMLRERILEPLHMDNTGLDSNKRIVDRYARGYKPVQTKSITETYVDRYARGYRRGKEGLVRARAMSMTVPWAAGSMYSTTGDLLWWERSLFGGKVLSDASLKAMTMLGKGSYGLGVYITEKYGVKAIWHSGEFRGVKAYLMYVPAPKITVVVLSNVNGLGVNRLTTDIIANQLLKVALGKKVVLASERKAVPISEQELAKFEGTYKLPGLSLTFAADGDTLTAKGLMYVSPLLYVGVKDGHPHFYLEPLNAEIEFVPDARGKMTSIVWHRLGREILGTRQLSRSDVISSRFNGGLRAGDFQECFARVYVGRV
jgi:CubicO group peptidase (beta-lactamase class C family)